MADVENSDGPEPIIDFVNDAVIAAADSVALAPGELPGPVRAGIGCESLDISLKAKPVFLGQLCQLLDCPPQNGDLVGHLRRRSSFFACLNGIALLREALAAS